MAFCHEPRQLSVFWFEWASDWFCVACMAREWSKPGCPRLWLLLSMRFGCGYVPMLVKSRAVMSAMVDLVFIVVPFRVSVLFELVRLMFAGLPSLTLCTGLYISLHR